EEFLAASMTLDMANTDKLAMFVGEARKAGIGVLPPCVNASDVEFAVELNPPSPRPREEGHTEGVLSARREGRPQAASSVAATHPSPLPASGEKGEARGAIRYALAGLKNLGRGAVETIVAERAAKGPFADL